MTWDEFINYQIIQLGEFKLIVGNLLIGILVAIGTAVLVFLLKKAITRPKFIINKIDSKRRISFFLIAKYFIWVISFITILEILGIDITMIVIGSTALLVGLGLGLQNIFKDLISGLFLLFEGTIKIGDIIEADGVVGKIMEINLRSSEVLTRDDVTIIIPNSKFVVEKVVNWSHNGEDVRFQIKVNVAYGSDVEKVFSCLEEAMTENDNIAKSPRPFVRFINFGDSALEFEMIFWSSKTFRIENVKSDLRRQVYSKLKENGLAIPFPQRDIHIKGLEKTIDFKEVEKNN